MKSKAQRGSYRRERDEEQYSEQFGNRRQDDLENTFDRDDDFLDADDNVYEDRYSPRQYRDDFDDDYYREYIDNYDDDDEFERLTSNGRRGYENIGRNFERGRMNEQNDNRSIRSNRPLRGGSSGHEIGSGFASRGGDKARRFASLGGKTSHVSERNQRSPDRINRGHGGGRRRNY